MVQKAKTKIKIRKLKDPKLRKIRYEIRTLFYLIYKDGLLRLRNVSGIPQRELSKSFSQSPIGCWWCGNRMRDLQLYPEWNHWGCVDGKCTPGQDPSSP
ncbi:MAG TPA: hypothetical protein ENI29_02670 [bacterium]|nr:hypothetical protein [bacterium]